MPANEPFTPVNPVNPVTTTTKVAGPEKPTLDDLEALVRQARAYGIPGETRVRVVGNSMRPHLEITVDGPVRKVATPEVPISDPQVRAAWKTICQAVAEANRAAKCPVSDGGEKDDTPPTTGTTPRRDGLVSEAVPPYSVWKTAIKTLTEAMAEVKCPVSDGGEKDDTPPPATGPTQSDTLKALADWWWTHEVQHFISGASGQHVERKGKDRLSSHEALARGLRRIR